MKDVEKAKGQPMNELIEMRQRIAELEALERKHKRVEKTLIKGNEQYRRLMELCPETIAIHSQGKIVYINPAGAKLLGLARPEELIGKSIMDFVHPDYQKTIKKRIQQSFERRKITPLIEDKLVRPDGKVIFVETIATPITYRGKPAMLDMARDITERKKAEEEIKVKSQFLESLIEQSPLPTFVIDSEGIVVMANKAFLKAYNVPKKEAVLGMNALTEPANVRQGVVKYIKEALSGKIVETPEIEFISPYENKRTVTKSRLFPIFDATTTLTNVVVMHEDITERKRAENQIKASLKEKEVLLREIHHRVKNNLQIISSLLNLESRYIKDEQTLEVFKEIQNRIRSMALIHEKLYQSKDLARIDFAGYIRSLVADLFRSYKANSHLITLKTNIDDVLLGIDTAISCGLIINELVSNSLKYAFPEGRQGAIHVDFHLGEEGKFTLIVGDNSVGFPKDLDFRNTESLGLRLTCTLVDQLEGTIELDRSGGTEFKVTFTQKKYGRGG